MLPSLTPTRMGMPASLAGLDDLVDLLAVLDVAGVEADLVHAGLDRLQGPLEVEVHVGDDRHGDWRRISGRAAVSSLSGTATRTTSHPAAARRLIWATVASMSWV